MSDSLCLMTSFHLQHTWDLPAESPGCVMLLRASLGSKLLLSINYWGKHASKGKADGKNRKERLCRCHHCGACLRPGVSLLYCIKQVCKYSQKWPTPASPTTYLWGFWRVVASSCFISSTSCPPPQSSVLPSISHSFPCKAGWFWWRAAGCTKSLQVKNAQSSWHFQERLEWKPELV